MNGLEEISLQDYETMLKDHDWYYQFSDNAQVYDKGWRNQAKLRALAFQTAEHQQLYQKHVKERYPKQKL